MSEQAQQTAVIPAPPDPDSEPAAGGFDDFEELPPRPHRRLATPVNLGLLAVLVVAAGFIAGVLVEKGQTSGTASGAGGGGARRAAAAGGGAGGGGGTRTAGGAAAAGATIGTVSTVNGHTLYVTDSQGTTIKVTAASSATVIRTATSPVSAIHPGDTVILQGTKASDGSLSASSIRATAPNAAGGGFAGLGGGATGATGGTGGTASRGGTGSGAAAGGGAAAAPQLFGG